ncbi:MAG: LysR family transcriptional regulator [Eggerthellaceae bacterium]|nr:LysR family transcriptional regulator [Eggerthellaceae bacterium]
MNLDHLYYFKTLVETKSRTATAEKLAITPSTLSLAITKLERELNTSLLDKKRGSVSLTTDGQVFYEYIATALRFVDGGIKILQERNGGGSLKAKSLLEQFFRFKTKIGRKLLVVFASKPTAMFV